MSRETPPISQAKEYDPVVPAAIVVLVLEHLHTKHTDTTHIHTNINRQGIYTVPTCPSFFMRRASLLFV